MSALPETFSEPNDVARELAELGLTVYPFQVALSRGRLEWATHTENDAPSYPGTMFWGTTLRALREELLALGWTKDDPKNLSVTISPDGSRLIVVETGDEKTGNPDGTAIPATKSPKGAAIAELIQRNIQGDLFTGPFQSNPAVTGDVHAWVFLIRITPDGEPVAELSLPNAMGVDGKIVGWRRRIVIPRLDESDDSPLGAWRRGPEPAPDVEVTVTRRAG